MDEMLKRLKNDFNDFSCTAQDDGCLHMHTNWRACTQGVSKVCVRLRGIEPLTGACLPENYLTATFDHLTTRFTSAKLNLYGTYELVFEAYDSSGSKLGEPFQTQKIVIKNPDKCPRVTYSIRALNEAWSCVVIRTNCAGRLRGHLWIAYNGRQYPVRGDMNAREMYIYIPSTKASLFTDEEALPEPLFKRG